MGRIKDIVITNLELKSKLQKLNLEHDSEEITSIADLILENEELQAMIADQTRWSK